MTLRDFNNDAPFPADPRALHNEPLGNGAGLENFHTTQPEDIEPNNMPKIVGAVAVALMLGAAGVALYASSGSHPATVATASNTLTALPPPPAPAPAATTPDSSTPATPPAADNTPAAAAPMKEASIPKTQKMHRTASIESKSIATGSKSASVNAAPGSAAADRMAADTNQSTVQPEQQQAVAAPVAPTPSPSDVASNNTQSGVAVSPNATTASDIPAPAQQQATPQASAPAPAQQQPSGADQSAGQVNQ